MARSIRPLRAWLSASLAGFALLATTASVPVRAGQVVVSHYAELMYGAPWAIALDQGFFKKRGVDITELLTSDGGGTTIRNMMASDVPYTETALSAALSAIHDGLDLKIVDGAVNNAADLVWVVKPNSPLKNIHDLAGKKIAYTRASSTTQILGLAALQSAGVDPTKVTMLSLGTIGGGLTALDQGAVDAAPELDPTYSRNASKYRVLFAVSDVMPPVTQHVGVVSTKFLQEHPDQVKGLILARRDGVQFMKAHPDQAVAIIAKAYDMPPGPITLAFKRLIAANYWSEGKLDYSAMDRAVVGLHVAGVYPDAKVDWSKVVNESALPADLRSTK
ncbi:ABC transporter substrate-binding protein [Paraburkholderia jirisanensis]